MGGTERRAIRYWEVVARWKAGVHGEKEWVMVVGARPPLALWKVLRAVGRRCRGAGIRGIRRMRNMDEAGFENALEAEVILNG